MAITVKHVVPVSPTTIKHTKKIHLEEESNISPNTMLNSPRSLKLLFLEIIAFYVLPIIYIIFSILYFALYISLHK